MRPLYLDVLAAIVALACLGGILALSILHEPVPESITFAFTAAVAIVIRGAASLKAG